MNSSKHDDNQSTPSWKVNLTEKFNKFYKTKAPQNQTTKVLSFEDELQQQLKFIPLQREELSSNKKSNIYLCQPQYSNPEGDKIPHIKIQEQKCFKQLKYEHHKQKKYSQEESNFSLFTNRKVATLFQEYFSQRQSIELKQLVQMCCLQYLKKQSLTTQLKQLLINQCRHIFCTTDQNLVSLNAIELATKKTDLQLIIMQKFLHSKYKKKKKDLQKEYQQILVQIIQQQNNIKEDNGKLAERKRSIEIKEKQLLKRQKTIKNTQKQLLQKEKHMKNILQEKYIKLTSQMSHQFQNLTRKLEKKSQTLERNARNKLQLLDKRLNDQKNQSSNKNIPQKDSDDLASKKYQNQVLLLKSKLRKVEKQFEAYLIEKNKQIKNLQSQSNSLLKANTLLQNKLQKSKTKHKELNQIMAKKGVELLEIRRELQQRLQRIQQLENYVLELEHQTRHHVQQTTIQNSKPQRCELKLQEKQSNQHKNSLLKNEQKLNKKPSHTCENCQSLIDKTNVLIGLIIKGFENQQKNSNPKENFSTLKIEEILLKEAQPIVLVCADILWKSMQLNVTEIQNILLFMLKIFMANFSFLKFRSITQNQDEANLIQNFVQTIQSSFSQSHPKSTESKLKICSIYLQYFEHNSAPQNLFNLNLVLTLLGFDELYCQKKSKLQPIINKLQVLLIKDIQKSQTRPLKRNKIIQKFQDEQNMTYLFWKYMSYSTSQPQSFTFIDILVELCNYYSLTYQPSKIPLFKTILALQNYKHLFNFLIIHFTQQNLLNKNSKQMLQKVSIVLQRFCYAFGSNINVQDIDLKRLNKIVKQLNKNKQFDESLFRANMENLVEKLSQENQ